MRYLQRGQVLPLGLLLVAAGMLTAIVLFNTGRMTSEKARLANTADAAAYSGMIWQARAMNFQSYSNRSMVANQVAMAQAVSLKSWLLQQRISAENTNVVIGWFPPVAALVNTYSQLVGQVEDVGDKATEVMLKVADLVNKGLSKAQKSVFASSFIATPQVVDSVVKANDTNFYHDTNFSVISNLSNKSSWDRFTESYDSQDKAAMRARADVINRSLDTFSKKRNWNKGIKLNAVVGSVDLRLYKEGETKLIESENSNGSGLQYEWKAKDNFEFHKRAKAFGMQKTIRTPIGWGQAHANNLSGSNSVEGSRWFYRTRRSEAWSNNQYTSLLGSKSNKKFSNKYSGIQTYQSLSRAIESEDDPRLQLKVEVAMNIDSLNNQSISTSSNKFHSPVESPGNMLSSVSVAELFYQRPDESLLQPREKANGYNPYWDVRLSKVPTSDLVLAFSSRPATRSATSSVIALGLLSTYGGAAVAGGSTRSSASGLGSYTDRAETVLKQDSSNE